MKVLLRLGAVSAIMLSSYPATVAAQTSGPPPARAVGPLADSLRALAYRMAELLRNRDSRGIVALYGDPAHFVHIGAGNVIPWPQLSAMMTSYLDTAKSNPVSVTEEPGVTLIDANNAVVYVVHHFGASEGPTARTAHDGVWTGVLHRFPDGWKIVHSHSSDRRQREEHRR